MSNLGKVILCARGFLKMSKSDKDKFKELTLDKWTEGSNKEKQQIIFDANKDLIASFFDIAERHPDLKGKQ